MRWWGGLALISLITLAAVFCAPLSARADLWDDACTTMSRSADPESSDVDSISLTVFGLVRPEMHQQITSVLERSFRDFPDINTVKLYLSSRGGNVDSAIAIRNFLRGLEEQHGMKVIARGSSFRFRGVDPDIAELRRLLRVRYCLTGMVEMFGTRITIVVELADTRDGGAIWGDRFTASLDDVHEIRTRIIASVVAALELQIPLNEARVARLSTPNSLDAWSSYHLGLQHLLRFTREDNAAAAELFARAVREDPGFSRAHAGLSSTHFQNTFLKYTRDPASEILKAKEAAANATQLDPMDPFSNFAMGRTFWLEGDLNGSLGWLDRATAISPSYAQGIYAQAWTDTPSGRGHEGLANAHTAMSLSPLDPLLYAMLGTRSLAYILQGDEAKAATWAEKAARAPGAHFMIAMIAHSLGGNRDAAASWAENVRSRRPDVTGHDFFQSFPFRDEDVRSRMARALAEHRL